MFSVRQIVFFENFLLTLCLRTVCIDFSIRLIVNQNFHHSSVVIGTGNYLNSRSYKIQRNTFIPLWSIQILNCTVIIYLFFPIAPCTFIDNMAVGIINHSRSYAFVFYRNKLCFLRLQLRSHCCNLIFHSAQFFVCCYILVRVGFYITCD